MKTRRIIATFLVFSLLLGASASKKKEKPSETTTELTTTEQTTTQPTSTTVDTVNGLYDPSNPNALNPLTGLQLMDPENEGMRSVAIVINNCYNALPQRGISEADAIYEYETEGGQTRLLALFADVNTVPEVGSLRSARVISSDLAAGTNSIFIHYGRNARVPDHLTEFGIDHVDGNNCSADSNSSANGPVVLGEGLFFWRDSTWLSLRSREHTAVSDGEHISAAIDYFNIDRVGETPLLFNFVPDNSVDIENGSPCTTLNVFFSATNDDALFTYDPEFFIYYKTQYGGEAQIDETSGNQVAVTNVIVLFADIQPHGDGTIDAYLQSGGNGLYASQGQMVPITWTKPTPNDPITIYNMDGDIVEVNRGVSYICVVDNDYESDTTYS